MNKLEISESGVSPVLIAVTGVITFLALLLGFLFIKRQIEKKTAKYEQMTAAEKAKQKKKKQKGEKKEGERAAPEGADADDVHGDSLAHGNWPVDSDVTVKKDIDPLEYCSHIPAEIRKTQQRIALEEAEKAMDAETKIKEREIQRQQLAAIFTLMEKQKEKFGVDTMDDVNEQMKLYTVAT